MKIYIDSADIKQIKEAFSWGIVDGITTNPSLIKAAFDKAEDGVTMQDYISRILEAAGETPVSLEVIGPSEAAMTARVSSSTRPSIRSPGTWSSRFP